MSQTANQILETLLNRKDIGENSAYNLMTELAEGVVAPPLAGALLTALRLKVNPPKKSGVLPEP